MFLTLEILEKYDACESGKKWFEHYFPDGGELIDIINHKFVTPDILHWGYTNLTTTSEEQEAYWRKLNVDCERRWSIYESDNITNGSFVSRSSRVKLGAYVFGSKDVTDSTNVLSSSNVERSSKIFNSEFVYDSHKVSHGKNITESVNVVNSDYVVRSSSVMNAAVVTNSHFVNSLTTGTTKQIKNSMFIADCENMKNCLFCANTKNGEYLLFNQSIDTDQFDMITKQLTSILGGWQAELVCDHAWPGETIPLDSPQIQRNVLRQYKNLPETFWRWVKTLPYYNPSILYALTFQPHML